MASDVLHLLRTFRANLDQFDQQKLSVDAEAEILAACEERILPSWREHWHLRNLCLGKVNGILILGCGANCGKKE